MKTIIDAVNERLARLKNLKEMESDDKRDALYRKFPGLRKIDNDLIDVRTARMICSIENDKEPVPLLNKREENLIKEREDFIKEHKIPANFTQAFVVCDKCNDTGFVTTKDGRRVICTSCMKDALTEVFDESGLKDFQTYDIKGFDISYNSDRNRMFKGLRSLMEGSSEKKLMLLSGAPQTGKTYLSVVACKYAILQGLSAYYVKADRLESFKYDDIDELKDYDLVIIDDYAAEVTRVSRIATALHNLLEARLAAGRSTVIVSTSPLEVLVSDSDERIAGKLRTAGTL